MGVRGLKLTLGSIEWVINGGFITTLAVAPEAPSSIRITSYLIISSNNLNFSIMLILSCLDVLTLDHVL